MGVQPSDIIASLALLLSAFATWKTLQFNARQKTLIETQAKLNQLSLEKTKSEAIADKKADLGANFVKLGANSNYRLRVFNKGKASARNVRVEIPEENDVISAGDVTRKFPMEVLEQHQSVDLIAAVHMGSNPKQPIKLIWDDDNSANNEKVVYATW